MTRAKPVGGWYETAIGWIDDQTALVIPESDDEEPHLLDVRTGKKTPQPEIASMLRRMRHESMRLSPDGHWLHLSLHGQARLIDLRTFRAGPPHPEDQFLRWTDDSKAYLANLTSNYSALHLCRVDSQHADGLVLPPGAKPPADLVRLLADGAATLVNWHGTGRDGVTVRESDLKRGQVLRNSLVHPPPGAAVASVSISADGKRLAWTMAPEQGLLERWFHGSRATTSVWISRAAGSDMRLVGSAPAYIGGNAERSEGNLSQAYWLPSGRALEFVYQGTLYQVDAP